MATTPHFAFPFKFQGTSFVQNEQDSLDDIVSCVACVVLYHPGERELQPNFGVNDMVFDLQPVDLGELLAAAGEFEPRAAVLAQTNPDPNDPVVAQILIQVSAKGVT